MNLKIITDHPVAYDSHDHIVPKGTANDFTKNGLYVRELIRKFGNDMKYMDLGCAGGGFIVQFLNYGVFAVGVEGSDHCLKHKKFGWELFPDNFFTADITKPFHLEQDGEYVKFNAISAFDVLEHIPEEKLDILISNIYNQLSDDGIFIASIATFEDKDYHVTLHEKDWWVDRFKQYNLIVTEGLSNYGRTSSFEVVWKKSNGYV